MDKVLSFLETLNSNNNREWFTNNRKMYDNAKLEFIDLVNKLINEIAVFDAEAGMNAAEKCIFRIYRDVRFSQNKLPYKTHMGAYIAPGGRNRGKAGYYIHIEPKGSFLAAGVYAPEPLALKAIRQEIYYHAESFLDIMEKPSFKQKFGSMLEEKLVRPPKGFPKEFEHIEWLKYKHYVVSASLKDKLLQQSDLVDYIMKYFREAYPLNQFLNKAIQMIE